MIRLQPQRPRQLLAHRAQHVAEVATRGRRRAREIEVAQNLREHRAQPVLQRVVAAIGRRVAFEIFGGNRRPHEDEVVVIVGAVQNLAAHRVEEGLGQLRLLVVGHQPDVLQLDLLPQRVAQVVGVELALQALDRLLDALVVELDALGVRAPHRRPVGGLEALLRLAARPAGTCGSAC